MITKENRELLHYLLEQAFYTPEAKTVLKARIDQLQTEEEYHKALIALMRQSNGPSLKSPIVWRKHLKHRHSLQLASRKKSTKRP